MVLAVRDDVHPRRGARGVRLPRAVQLGHDAVQRRVVDYARQREALLPVALQRRASAPGLDRVEEDTGERELVDRGQALGLDAIGAAGRVWSAFAVLRCASCGLTSASTATRTAAFS